MTVRIKQIVVVDDNEQAREPLVDYGKLQGWDVFTSDGACQPEGLDGDEPILVLLDFELGNCEPGEWLSEFRRLFPKALVYLITGHVVDKQEMIDDFVDLHSIQGTLKKPFRLDRLPGLLEWENGFVTTAPAEESEGPDKVVLAEAADALEPAVHVLRPDTLDRVYWNKKAAVRGFNSADPMVQKIAAKLRQDPALSRVTRTDWEPKENKFLRRRLYRAGRWYWLAEDWKSEAEDEEIVRLMLPRKDPNERLRVVADIFEARLGITRVRFYRTSRIAGWAEVGRNEVHDGYLLRPEWQTGGGFEGGDNAWLRFQFRIFDAPDARAAFRERERPWLISPVTDAEPESKRGCLPIVWGNAKTRLEIPIRDDDGNPVALLALDRRSDHLKPTRIQDSEPNTDIADEEVEGMQGYIDAIRPMLEDIVDKRREARRALWRDDLQRFMSDALQWSDARRAISALCAEVQAFWDGIGAPLSDVLVLVKQYKGMLGAWAGAGPRWERLRTYTGLLRPVPPFDDVVRPYRVVQDLCSAWRSLDRTQQHILGSFFSPDAAVSEPTGSMALLPFFDGEQVEGFLVVATAERFAFSENRIEALQDAANAMHPLVRWGLAQGKTDFLTHAFAHGFKRPRNLIERILKKVPGSVSRDAEQMLNLLDAGIRNLNYLGRPESVPVESPEELDLLLLLSEVVGWVSHLVPGVEPLLPNGHCVVTAPRAALQQVLFNLVHNACKYATTGTGDGGVVTIECASSQGRVALRLWNSVAEPIDDVDRSRIWYPYVRGNSAGSAEGAGIGLAVVDQLCRMNHWSCVLEDAGQGANGMVCFQLVLTDRSEEVNR
jgi:hypothetical protein